MLVYRLEHARKKEGPYSAGTDGAYDLQMVLKIHQVPHEFPEFRKRFGFDVPKDHIFGWDSLEKALEFVEHENPQEILKACGFVWNIYETNDCYILPDGQVMFVKETAKVVKYVQNLYA